MRSLPALILLVSWALPGHADVCAERIILLTEPIFPVSFNAVHVLNKEQYCSIDVAYSINSDGKAENLESRAEKEVCDVFKISAMRALRSSMFIPGDYLQLCYMNLVIKLVDGQMKWEYKSFTLPPLP
jgi:hypothetical protein